MEHFSKVNIKIKFNNTVQKSVISFDTECSTVFSKDGGTWECFNKNMPDGYYNDMLKQSFMYIFAFCIDGMCFYGRTGGELKDCCEKIKEAAQGKNVVIYVHNLNYDFQVLRSFIKFDEVFARDKRTILYATCKEYNITFKCSYNLSGLKLADIPAIFHTETKKLVGDLDYNVLRTYKTKLTEQEMAYVENDVKIVYEYIVKEAQEAGTIKKIALTKTGKVRKAFKNKLKEVYGKFYYSIWTYYIKSIEYMDYRKYKILNEMSSGGYVHANMNYINKIVNGHSYDKKSFYPSIMLTEKFQSSEFKVVDDVDMTDIDCDNYCYMFDIQFYDIKSKCDMTMLSLCDTIMDVGSVLDNGRIISSEYINCWMNEIDLMNFIRCYDYSSFNVKKVYRAEKNYLPKEMIEFIIECYIEKDRCSTERDKYEIGSKDWKYWDTKRTMAKVRLNSIFGMTMTKNVVFNSESWDNGWQDFFNHEKTNLEIQTELDNQNSYFLFSWGVWVMSYARKILFDAIMENDGKIVYSDTDCVKSIGELDFTKFDAIYDEKLAKMAEIYDIDVSKVKGIGHFVDETPSGMKFKTLGQKKYVCEINGKVKCVAAGVAPASVSEAIGNDISKFDDELVFGYEAGCVCVCYNDEQADITIGGVEISQQYGVCIYPAKFKMKKSIINTLEVL